MATAQLPNRIARSLRSDEWSFFGVLPRADRQLAAAWWLVLALRGLLPALFALAMGALVGAIASAGSLVWPLALTGVVLLALQTLAPLHQAVSANLGSKTAAWLYDQLTETCVAPPGIGHLERPELAADLTMARDFDLGISGPPLAISMDFITAGMVELIGGLASMALLMGYRWWAPMLLVGAWIATHVLLRESAVWRDRNTEEVREAQQHADYAYRLAVDAPAAKELRLFGLGGWVVDRFVARRTRLYELQWTATRLRERSVLWSVVIVLAANAAVFWRLAEDANSGSISLGAAVVFAQAAIGASAIAFGGLSWALSGAAQPIAAVLRLQRAMPPAGALPLGAHSAERLPTHAISFRGVRFAYPGSDTPVLDGLDLTIPAGSSLAIVGLNGAGKTTIAKLLCRLYDPQAGSIAIDGIDLRELDLEGWRARLAAVFQDFIRYELTLRENVAPLGAPDHAIRDALADAGADGLAELDTILARGYAGGIDLSGGQWQRVAIARALCAVRLGAGVVLLDEPTAQLDVRGEAAIFERVLAATRHCTTILVSHRFSTVRHADRICVLDGGRVVELGSHEELMALGGRYRSMFDLQAARFAAGEPEVPAEEEVYA